MIEAKVHQALSGITDKVTPLMLPQNATYPAITYFNVTPVPINHLKGESDTQNARIQVDIWAESYSEVKSLYLEVKTSMSAISSLFLGANEVYEDETKLYRLSLDFSVWE